MANKSHASRHMQIPSDKSKRNRAIATHTLILYSPQACVKCTYNPPSHTSREFEDRAMCNGAHSAIKHARFTSAHQHAVKCPHARALAQLTIRRELHARTTKPNKYSGDSELH